MSERDITSGCNDPFWINTVSTPLFPQLLDHSEADVCVIGAGISGLTTAYMLLKRGRTVTVVDDGKIGSGETGRTSAHLANGLDDRYFELERLHGRDGARMAAESHTQAIELIETICDEENIECEFERLDGFLFVPPGDPVDILDREVEAAHRAGLVGVQLLDHAPLAPFNTGPCLRFPNQAQFQPLKYLNGLASAIIRMGGHIFNRTHIDKIEGGDRAFVRSDAGIIIRCAAIVVATNVPINDRVVVQTKLDPYRTYMIAARIPKGSVAKALYWDTPDPYHYVRVQDLADHDVLLIGGEDHRVGHAVDFEERYRRLEQWMRERFAMAQDIEYRWSGQIIEPVDGLAYIGRNPLDEDNVYVITGDSGNGLTHGTIGGMLVSDLITGKKNEWEDLYSPSRIRVKASSEFAKHNAAVAARYSDWLTRSEVESVDLIEVGSGAVVRHGLSKAAVYHDDSGELHACSAVCPHLGGQVHWNKNEKTWDCPVHGSRFDRYGQVMNGPANCSLKPIQIEDRVTLRQT